jgi:arsenate reductase
VVARLPSFSYKSQIAANGFRAMTITLYGIKNCDTMKKARSWLDAHEVRYALHDYKAAGVDPAVLAYWCGEVGWETLLNRAGTTFRNLPENQKQNMNERKAMTLMVAQPSMIKRPVLEYRKRLLVGFTPEVYEQVLRGHV